uniref:Uncharacterized protein n=1 Tax=Ditylum brightwellii TaxID=49249 RepID=A0A7S4UHI9_9STRA
MLWLLSFLCQYILVKCQFVQNTNIPPKKKRLPPCEKNLHPFKTSLTNIHTSSHTHASTESTVNPMESSSIALEAAGASIQQRRPIADVGEELYKCACSLEQLAMAIQQFDVDAKEPKECSTRMMFASTKMKEAGDELRGKKDKPKPKGKSWIKG